MNKLGFLAVLTIAGALAGCGGGEKKTEDAPVVVAPAPAGTKVFKLTGDDTMRYNLTELHATPGEPLRIVMTNMGKMPKQAMSHNFVLVKPMTEAEANKLAMDAAMKAPTYLPADQSAIIVHTKLLGPGESDTIDFKAPSEPGEYPYFCTFPGHFTLMKGKLIVK